MSNSDTPVQLGKVSAATFTNYALHTVFDDGGNTFVLASALRQPQVFHINPDGNKAYLRNLYLIKIDIAGEVTKLHLGDIYSGSDTQGELGALWVEAGYIYAFQNSMQISSLKDFSMEGFFFTINASSMSLESVETLFDNANFGFVPVIYPGPIVVHFSFDQYLRCLNDSCLEYVVPDTMGAEYDAAAVAQSGGLVLPGEASILPKDATAVISRILSRFNGAPTPSSPQPLLPILGNVNLPLPRLPSLGHSGRVFLIGGANHSLALGKNGDLWSWGGDNLGQLGLNRLVKSLLPSPVKIEPGFIKIAAGAEHTLALKADGSLWAWGRNDSGQLGDGHNMHRSTPFLIGGGFTNIAVGSRHSLALKDDSSLWGWGDNRNGQLGDGSKRSQSLPMRIGDGFVTIAAGDSHSLGIKADGTLFAWGNNKFGQLGSGGNQDSLTPVKIASGFTVIYARDRSSMALKSDGSLWAWGWNGSGQLGDGTRNDSSVPVKVGDNFAEIALGWGHTLALKTDKSLWAWGRNFGGQLGNETRETSLIPIQVGSDYVAIAAGNAHSLGMRVDGSLWAWGYNVDGVLGNGSVSTCLKPCLIEKSGVATIAAGSTHSLAVKADGKLYAWGDNSFDQLGEGANGSGVFRAAPTKVGSGFLEISSRSEHSLALKGSEGSLLAWGDNSEGQLGNGDGGFLTYATSPVVIGFGFVAIAGGGAHSLALKSDDGLWSWGYNFYGQLSDNDSFITSNRWIPIKVSSGFSAVAAGGIHSLALKPDGSLWTWGNNYFGQLGQGTFGPRKIEPVPTQIGTGYAAVAAGKWHSLGLKTDGSLWGWGYNHFGQVGNGVASGEFIASPALIGQGFVAISAGDYHSLAVRSDGSLWAWGENRAGQLGNGSLVRSDFPSLVGHRYTKSTGGKNHSLAVGIDGTVWSFGVNNSGQLGDGTYSNHATPTLVINETIDGPLDLLPDIPNAIPSDKIPPFFVVATKTGELSSLSLSARVRLAPVDLNGNALAQTNRFAAGCGSGGTCRMYVAALAPAGDKTPVCAPSSVSVTESLWTPDAQRNWSEQVWPLPAFLSNAAPGQDQTVQVDILSNCNLTDQKRTEFYLGYGEDADEMLNAGRHQKILTVPDK